MSNPYLIATGTQTAGSTSLTISVATASSAGDVIQVCANIGGQEHVTAVSDTKGNSYTLLSSNTGQVSTYQYATTGTPIPLTLSDTITLTFNNTANNKNVIVVGIPGVISTPDKLPAAVAAASGTSASIASGSLSSTSEVIIVIAGTENASLTWNAGFTSLTNLTTNRPALGVAYQVVSSGASVTATATFTSGKSCLLMATYATAVPSSSYLVGKNNAPSGGSTTLAVPVTGTVAQGDTVLVGALANSGSVTGVTDPSGNSYSLIKSETTSPTCQLYTFASYNSDPLAPGTHGSAGRVGSTVSVGNYPSAGTSRQTGANDFDAIVGQSWANSSQKIYTPTVPAALHDASGHDLTSLVAAGCQFVICCQPALDGSSSAALQTALQFWLTAGAKIKVVMYQEPQGNNFNITAAQFIQCYKNYYSMIHGLGIPVVYDASGYHQSEWLSWYPGKNYVDEVMIDWYCDIANGQFKTSADPLLSLRQVADADGKPFGLGEIGYSANTKDQPTLATFTNYIQYIQSVFTTRLQQGLTNSDIMWYDGDPGVDGINTLQTNGTVNGEPGSTNPIQVLSLLKNLYTAVTSVSTTVNVTYSTNASIQAAIAVGDHNIQQTSDKVVGATATTGTTASVATGTLAQAQEHIVAFEANLFAGGSPVLGDGLTTAGTVTAGTTAYLTAGYKAVNSTASDTPSATIASTIWAITAVTNPLVVPVVTTTPGQGFVGQPYSFTLQESGGIAPITWGTTGGSLPTGLSLAASTGIISGTPTVGGAYPFTLTATDSLGLVGSLPVVMTVVGVTTPGAVPAQILEGNILSPGDSDAETSSGWTWAPFSNANAPAISSVFALSGGSCTQWSVPTAGDTSVATGLYPVEGALPYICSAYILPSAPRNCYLSIAWYDSTQTLINLDSDVPAGTNAGMWQPLSFATVSPANAAFASLVVTAAGASAGDVLNLDLAFLSQSSVQVLIDWVNPAFDDGGAAGQAFMDVSPWLRHDIGTTYSRGRQDAVSQVQPGSASFSLQNDQGTFARGSTAALPGVLGGQVSLQARAQVNLSDELGQWWTRFDGSVAQIDYSYDGTGNTSLAAITLTDVLSSLNRQDNLFCWTKGQVLADAPMFHWSLDDPGNTGGTGPAGAGPFGTAAETSGSNGPPMRLVNTDSTKVATIAWQDTSGGVETLADAVAVNQPDGSEFWTAGVNLPNSPLRGLDSNTVGPYTTPLGGVYFTPVLTAQSAQNQFVGNNGYYLQAELPQTLSITNPAQGYAFECWFTMDPQIGAHLSADYGPYIQLSLGSSRQKATLVAGLFLNAGALQYKVANYNQPPAFLGLNWPGNPPPVPLDSNTVALPPDVVQRPHHLVLNVNGPLAGIGSVEVYLDGVLLGDVNLVKGQAIDTICVGAAYGGTGAHYGGIQLVSAYSGILSQQQITLHCQLGQYGMWESPSDDALAQVASYANVPSFWTNVSALHNGLTLTEYMDLTGANALAAMQIIAQAENGLLYVDATGALNFHTRDWRMGYGGPDLLLPPESYSPSMSQQVVDQFMCNEMGVAGPATTGATGAQGITLSTTTGNLQQATVAVNSANVQAGFINAESQEQYGVYAPNPVSSPVSLPLITWSRSYAQLGTPSFTYWPDPGLIDVAAWNANSRSDPYMFPASLTVDLLTLDPNDTTTITVSPGGTAQVPIGISTFYGLEIDNMVAPTGTLPASFPNEGGSLEWFIEGISETIIINSRVMTLYVSPAEAQRAWIPGDPVYGVLGSTTRLGISQADLSVPQADGKDVSHDAGPPYWPPAFSSTMNNPDGSGNAFVGSGDMRGIAASLQLALQPPMCIVSGVSQAQSFGTGALTNPAMNWDTIHVDTAGGMGLYPGWPNWYVCTVPGFYEITGSLVWALTSTQAGYAGQGWIAIAQKAAQALGAGTGTPLTVGKYVCPVGESVRWNSSSTTPVCNATTRVYLGLGDMVALCGEHNFSSAHNTSAATVGSHMSIRFVGLATADDRTEINSLITTGGTVTLTTPGTPGVFTYTNTHTYAYQGSTGFSPYAKRNNDQDCYQGLKTGATEGSETSQVVFNSALIASQLTGKVITSATLSARNLTSWYKTGTKLMLGYTTQTPGATSYQPATATDTLNVFHQQFSTNERITFSLPVSLVEPFVTAGATALVLGDSLTKNLNYYGTWRGGPGGWTLTVNYR